MKKRVAFRSFVILLATALLLSSTGAYNLLVYANQDSVANSLSAIESASDSSYDAETTEPDISIQGGELSLDSDTSTEPLATTVELEGSGTQENPYIILTPEHLLYANDIVNAKVSGSDNDDTENKYFKLGADINLTSIFADSDNLPFPESAGNAYLVSTNFRQPTSTVIRFIIDGEYQDEQTGEYKKHKIYCDEGTVITVPHENFALFGYLNEESKVSNIIFENINVSATSDQPKRMSVISYMNAGIIENCEVNNSSITLASPTISADNTNGASVTIDSYTLYNGIAAVASDNSTYPTSEKTAKITNVKVNNFTVTLPTNSSNDYVAGLVGQNRGLLDSCSVSGLKISLTGNNHYVGGLAGYNETTGTDCGIKNCSVDFAGVSSVKNNINGGGFVGGLVGMNNGYVYNSTVTGSVTSAQAVISTDYNIRCSVDCGSDAAYYGGITGVNKGTIVSSTVYNVGAYMPSVYYDGYFGGIAAITTGTISGCVASGSFVSANINYGYAGGILAYADSNTPDGAISNSYALFRLVNPAKAYIGAVIGFGGNANTATGCYWSDAVSKCATAYVFTDTADARRPYIIETTAGKLNSTNRAVVVDRGGTGTLSASDNIHTFNSFSGTTAATVSVGSDVSYNGSGSNNTLVTQSYVADFNFENTGAGASSMQSLPVSIALDVFISTNAKGDPDYDPAKETSANNRPFEITSSEMALAFIQGAPYGNYKLTKDILISKSSWSPVLFSGSIYGDDNIIATDTKIFTAVIGTRDTKPEYTLNENFVNDPTLDTANKKGGVISNLNIELSADMTTSVLGTVYNSTVINVALTDGDPTPDDGDTAAYEGYIADLSSASVYSAAFIDCAIGNSYIYGCSTDVSVKFSTSSNYVAGFISYLSGSVVVNNCFVNSISVYVSGSTDSGSELSRAAFIANTQGNSTGMVANSIVSARVIGSSYVYTVLGEHKGQYSNGYNNIVWSKLDYSSTNKASNIPQSYITLWGAEDGTTQSIMAGNGSVYSVDIPKYVTAFENAAISDFAVSLVEFNESNTESEYTDSVFSIDNITVESGKLNVNVLASANANAGDSVYLKIYHFETGFQTYVKYQVKSSDFVTKDGYIIISTPEELVMLSDKITAQEYDYLSKAYKLDSTINMQGIEIAPIGSTSYPFTGVFDGNGNTIENLNITGEGSNIALFAAVNSSQTYTINGTEVNAGIFNLKIVNPSVSGADNVAVIAGSGTGKVNIHDIEIIDNITDTITVNATEKSVAAIIASTINCDIDIYNITLDGVSVQTSYTSDSVKYFKESSANTIGGIGGIIGDAEETDADAHTVNLYGINVNNLIISGSGDGYATVNAGGLVGTYQKFYETAASISASSLNIGKENTENETENNVTVSNLTVKTSGIAGGIVAATNAKTTIQNVKVTATEENGTKIYSTSEYYIGGIAGYIGAYKSYDNADAIVAVGKMYGTISGCTVENSEIKATDRNIAVADSTKTRNVVVGGIVGAVNGPATGDTLADCLVKDTHVEGIVVGGIVGANIKLTVISGNVLHINNCDISGSVITTSNECYPNSFESTYDFGVGGILGTNTADYSGSKSTSYISDLLIQYCDVDSQTTINNFIPYNTAYYSSTGGIVGTCTQYQSTGVQALLQYNTVSAVIISTADMGINSTTASNFNKNPNAQSSVIRVGTGGFIGTFCGVDKNTAAFTQYLSVANSVFDGAITGTDCIGGAVGAFVSSTSYSSTTSYIPQDLFISLVISGEINSSAADTSDTKIIRGGVVVGNISTYAASAARRLRDATYCYPFQVLTGNADTVAIFSNIYYSSFSIDTEIFPIFGYCALTTTQTPTNGLSPLYISSKYINSYYDVNLKSGTDDNGNTDVQLADQETDQVFVAQTFPEVTRGSFSLNIPDKNGEIPHWVGSNGSAATVSDTEYNSLTVTPKNPDTIDVSIDYIGSVTDGADWSYEARLPVGFKFTSTAYVPLQTVEFGGKTYYLITDPIDFKFIYRETDNLGYNYWLANDIEFTEDMFDSGMYKGGFTPIGTASAPFTGTLGSQPEDNGEQNRFEISGLQLSASEDSSVTGLFGYAQNAQFSNFKITDITSTADVKYAAAVAAVVNGSLTADNIVVENANISGADYSAGLFGGLFGSGSSNKWNISNSQLVGSVSADGSSYSTTIQGNLAAAGIVVHTDKYAGSISGVSVSGSAILQGTDNDTDDSTYFDNGAAGIAFAYSGNIAANGTTRNTVTNSLIKGEIAAGAVVRTYTSATDDTFTSFDHNTATNTSVAEHLSINSVDIISTIIEGTHTVVPDVDPTLSIGSGGILARVDAPIIQHTIVDCTIDEKTTVKAPYAVGGIVGCFETPLTSSLATEEYKLIVDNCDMQASVVMLQSKKITGTGSSYRLYTMGAGGVLGNLSVYSTISGINIRNCHVGGTISGDSAVGGLVGAIWTSGLSCDAAKFNKMTSHFAENCVISADFKNSAGESSFATNTPTTGIVVGYVYDIAVNGSTGIMGSATNTSYSEFTNQPFFNIYYSSYKYPSDSSYLFGVLKPGGANTNSMNTYACYTDYIFDMNSYSSTTENHTIDTAQTHSLKFSDQYRITHKDYDAEEGVMPVNSLEFAGGFGVKLTDFVFNAVPQSSEDTKLNYIFDSAASINGFTLTSVNNGGDALTQTATLKVEEVKTDSDKISVTYSDGTYTLAPADGITLTETVMFNLVFVYSNGLELAAAFKVEVSGNDYYYNETENTYFIFNASNLYSTIEKANASATIIQCYDIFCAIEDNERNNTIIKSANDYADSVTLADVLSAADLELLAKTVHFNPNYESGGTEPLEISISKYLGVDESALGTVKLSKLVDNISATQYGAYTENSSDHFNLDFAGTYRVLTAIADADTGLTQVGEYYSVYGFELHDVNVTAQGVDAVNAGFFKSLNGATVDGLTFVNPKVEVIASRGVENYVGVLAGSAVGADIKNVSVALDGEQGEAYVMSLRQMTPASTNVGGIVGSADAATTLNNCTVSGLDIVGSTKAGNTSGKLYVAKVGGIAGSSAANIVFDESVTAVSNCRIMAERYDKFRNTYLSYAGGIAAWATGTVKNATVKSTLLRDVTCDVIVSGTSAKGSYVAEADNHEFVADRVGGIIAHAYGTVTVDSAKLYDVSMVAFDVAGGVIGEVENSETSAVTVSNCDVGNYDLADCNADIRVLSSSNLSTSNLRQFYNVAGGIVGMIDNAASVNISGCGVSGYVGTYSYDNLNKDCTAGGVIGYISDALTDLAVVSVIDTTVSGEVSGFRSGKTADAFAPYLGAAGGFIGKIRSTASGAAANGLVSHSVMAAEVNLYNSSTGTKVDATDTTVSTNVGKILGTLIEDGNFAEAAASSSTAITTYFNNIYLSSYPQDIVAYGCADFYSSQQLEPTATYTDINKATYTYTDENNATYTEIDNSFMIGSATEVDKTEAQNDVYSSTAIVPIDTSSKEPASASRHFRLMHDGIKFESGETTSNLIKFNATSGAYIVLSNGETTAATVTIHDGYENNYGTLTIGNVTEDIIGDVVLSYSYGLKVGVRLISMEIIGKGVEGDEFEISQPKHFEVVRALPDAYYKQTANIDLAPQYGYSATVSNPLWAGEEGFEPIGTQKLPFIGNYNGQGYLITNLYINRDSNYIGLFGYVGAGAVLKNIHIELAPLMKDVINSSENFNSKSDLVGGITGNSYVGGLAGFVNGAAITNCSVVKGNVIGNTALGGLIGQTKGATVDSCFTSTTVYSKLTGSNHVASTKNVGALIGYVGGTTEISGSFTFGYASLGVNGTNNYGAVGGLVGFVENNSKLTVKDVFVGASVSDSLGVSIGDKYYKGLTIGGSAASRTDIQVGNLRISVAGTTSQPYDTRVINPVLAAQGGASVIEGYENSVVYDADLLGNLHGDTEDNTKPIFSDESTVTAAKDGTFSLNGISLASNAGSDAYTAAYVALADVYVAPSAKEIADRSDDTRYTAGLFYPVTVTGTDIVLSSSVMDMTDTETYPEGMDADFYGNGSNKNTDLLFKVIDGGVKVYSNIYKNETGAYTGKIYENGEMFYNDNMPYFVVAKNAPVTVEGINSDNNVTVELYRKVVYPIQNRVDNSGRVYPLATERQLNSLAESVAEGTKFSVLTTDRSYTLTDDIVLGDYFFETIANYSGNFDGNGFKISNVNISKASDNVGFIAEMTAGSLSNVVLEIGTVSAVDEITGTRFDNVGALVGAIKPASDSFVNITNCSVSQMMSDDKVVGEGIKGGNNVGGLVGYAKAGTGSAISKSFTNVTVDGTNVVGGLVGYNEMAIDNSYSTGDVTASITGTYNGTHGIGGLAGVSTGATAILAYSFSSSAVEVSMDESTSYLSANDHGVGGLVGYVGSGANISTVFSSGSVRYCYTDEDGADGLPACNSLTLGVGGLVGVLCSPTTNVYSSASVAAKFGVVDAAAAVGAGGVVGVAKANLETAYSSGSTLGVTATDDYSASNYGVGGVIGALAGGAKGQNLYYDINVSAIEYEETDTKNMGSIGKIINGSYNNIGNRTTKEFTDGSTIKSLLGEGNFGYAIGAYPYLTSFFDENVSRTIQFNALLSIVAIQLNELDETAAAGDGISMAMTIPTGITHNGVTYSYGFDADNTLEGSATSIVDPNTNTLSVQRTSNLKEPANFIITIVAVDGAETAPSDGVVYKTVASRPLSRICAQMLGTEEYPYLVASQEDMKHVAMSTDEYNSTASADENSLYLSWNKPYNENGNELEGKVYYRMMGNIYLDGYARELGFYPLDNGYSFNGNGYFVHGLRENLADSVNEKSVVTNVTFKDTVFSEGESLLGILNGQAVGVNVFSAPINKPGYIHTKSSGNNVAGIADTVNGSVDGCVVNLDWEGTAEDSFAGIALTNKGTITKSAAVGDITGSSNNAAAFVSENNGTIMNCFTMGDIILASPKGIVAGFVGTNNSGIINCYTRCNIMVDGENENPSISSFVVVNSANSTINTCFAAGLFKVLNGTDAANIKHIFVGSNNGIVEDSMFDKQMSGSCFADDFYLAERTLAVATLENMNIMAKSAYVVSDNAGHTETIDGVETVVDIEYPQLKAIINTADEDDSRVYNTLRSYSELSSAGAYVLNDNYIDYLPYSSMTTITKKFSWNYGENDIVAPAIHGSDSSNPLGKAFTTGTAAGSTVLSVNDYEIEEFYVYSNEESKVYDTYNLYVTVNNNHNPNFSGGNGTSDNPYIISTKEQVVALSYYGTNPNSYFAIGEAKDDQGNDIDDITNGALDMTGTDWGANIDVFSAKLNGNGYTLANVTIPVNGCNALFGTLDGAEISNLGIAGISVNVPEGNTDAAGMLAAKVINSAEEGETAKTTTITNCVVVGTVTGPDGAPAQSEYIGGLIGDAQGPVVINGCVVSGKIVNSDGYAGGIIGKAEDGVNISNSLSTVFVNSGNSTAGGVIGCGPASGTATVTNTVFAGNVVGEAIGNIAGDSTNITVTNSYYDKQLSTVSTEESNVSASSTYYLTAGAPSGAFGTYMSWISGFAGYPVPLDIANGKVTVGETEITFGASFADAVKLASAKINFTNGVGAGSSTVFTAAVPSAIDGATLAVTGDAAVDDTKYVYVDNGKWSTDTGDMTLGSKYDGELEYTLGGMTRYVVISVGKVIHKVTYTIEGINSGSKSILSAITGDGNNATAATAFDTTLRGILCEDMIFDYEIDESNNAHLFRVDTQLPVGFKQGAVKAVFKNGSETVATADTAAENSISYIGEDGIAYIIIPVNENTNFDTVEITVTAQSDSAWGVRNLTGLFR